MSGHIFNLSGTKSTFSSQPVHSTNYGSQAEPSRTTSTQPVNSTFDSSNASRYSLKKKIGLNQDRPHVTEDLIYGDHDTLTSEEITSKRMKYDDQDENSMQKPKYMSDGLKQVMSSLSFLKEGRDEGYKKFNSYNDASSAYESSRPVNTNSKRVDKVVKFAGINIDM